MTISPRNDQKFIESVILYKVNNWTTIDRVCENLRKLGDNGLIPKSNSLPELSVKSITKFAESMYLIDTDSCQKDQNFIGSVILYEFLIGDNDKDKIHKKLFRRIGSDIINNSVFSHWYDRVKNGYFDIDDDSLVPKSPTFSELPVDVIGIIVEKLKLKEQLSLRKVSRNLRSLVDNQKPAYKTIIVIIGDDFVSVNFNDEYAVYSDAGVSRSFTKPIPKTESCDYVKLAFDDVAIAMKNPKLQLGFLEFDYLATSLCSNNFHETISGDVNVAMIHEKMRTLLETLNHKISVEELSMMTNEQHQLLSILPYLKPKILKTISIEYENSSLKGYKAHILTYHMDQIVALDQWKYAKDVTIEAFISSSIQHFLHFDRFDISLHSLSAEDMIRIRDEMLTSSEFQYLFISSQNMPSIVEIERIFGLQVVVNTPYGQRVYHMIIPHSNEFFLFEISRSFLSIKRMSR